MKLSPDVKKKYPGIAAGYAEASGVTVEPTSGGVAERKREVFAGLKKRYVVTPVIDIPEVKTWRAAFRAMGADPATYRPAPEYLLRRALDDRFPAISNLVDSCLVATVESWAAVSVFDAGKVKGGARVELAGADEKHFEIIDGRRLAPRGGEVVLRDDEKLLSAYTIGDAKSAAVTPETKSALIVVWGAPGIARESVEVALALMSDYVKRFCGGSVGRSEVL